MTSKLFSSILGLLFILFFFSGCSPRSYTPPMMPQIIQPPIVSSPMVFRENLKDQKYSEYNQRSDKKTLIVIDPGHGGDDFGTHSLNSPKYQEKYLNLSTSLFLKDYLQKMGYQTLMTRSDDEFISLDNRASFANSKEPAIFISVHYNSAPSKEADGIEVYYYNSEDDKSRTSESKLLASSVLKKVIQNTEAKSRGIKHGNFAVIRKTNMPAILIEGGFLTNENEMQKLKDASYLKQIAWGIAQGAEEYLSKKITK